MGECVFLASTQVSWPTASPAARTRRWRRCAQLPNEGGLRTKKEKVSSMKMGSSRRSVILKEVKMLWGSAFRSPKCMNMSTTSTTMPTITKSTIIWRSPGEGKEELHPAMKAKVPKKRKKKPRKREKMPGRKRRRRGSKGGEIGRVDSAK